MIQRSTTGIKQIAVALVATAIDTPDGVPSGVAFATLLTKASWWTLELHEYVIERLVAGNLLRRQGQLLFAGSEAR